MKIILQDKKKLLTTKLPKEINGNYWLTDNDKKNIVNIEAIDNKWVLKNNEEIKILNNTSDINKQSLYETDEIKEVILEEFSRGILYDFNKGIEYKYFCLPTYDNTMIQTDFNRSKISLITIGKSNSDTIKINDNSFMDSQISIINENKTLRIVNNNLNLPMFINSNISTMKELLPGDYVFINGFCLCLYGNILTFNNPNNLVTFNTNLLNLRLIPENPEIDYSTYPEVNVELYRKDEYFQRPPRFKRMIEPKEYRIDLPSGKQTDDMAMPIILTLGPMVMMGMVSMLSGVTAIIKVTNKESTFEESFQPMFTAFVMVIGMILFPLIQKLYMKHKKKKREKKRISRYNEYIDEKKEIIKKEINEERQILLENFLPLNEVENIIRNKDRTLWDRKIEHYDFLSVRLGIGSMPSYIKIAFPEEHFSIEKDDLRKIGDELVDQNKYIDNVPIVASFLNRRYTSFIGNKDYLRRYFDGIILQLIAYHSYDNLNIVVLSNNDERDYWKKYNSIPHFWETSKEIRFIGTNMEENNYISNYLLKVLQARVTSSEDKDNKVNLEEAYKRFTPYYLIITDNIEITKKLSFINELLSNPVNYGFSLIVLSDTIDNLPNEINEFVNLDPMESTMYESAIISNNQVKFIPELPNTNLNDCYIKICNIPIDIAKGKYNLPAKYAFLEMYDVGNVNQLNIINRWKESNVTQTLQAPVGVNEEGELFKIDLHEKAHGPHGLVAGMTGSGKSEWIITYILSMCINYHPNEVQFVLIDYKGGGLAGTFENKETGFKLPHLAGTITNLDITEINRSLASIESELKRRQALFNEARDSLGESSIDIYKYQRLYREGKIKEPISHLFIISDEFAELKSQQPEFMAQLISTARIGRSLGVHLILATQKPSGVVDDQIWSNAKFRVCLKVQEKADSKDMILVPDAAFLKEPGRFYLQVGYNEFFAKGQSAYAGSPYYESEKHKVNIDSSLEFVNDIGEVYKEINTKKQLADAEYKGEELPFILNAIKDAADKENVTIKQLWLDAIPAIILLDELKEKYQYKKENFIINPVIGEYDAPSSQSQHLLTLPISEKGNTLIYGAAGSGKEDTLSTIVYSLMTTYVAQEINLYVVDCGSEALNNFRKSPIVGDVILSSDEEKIKNLIKKLKSELETRKKLFIDYNADYYFYCKTSGKTLPNIVTIINNFEAFQELFSNYVDELIAITRDGEKYGIFFICTLSTLNGMRMKLSQNFKQNIVLQMNDQYDYRNILGSGNRIIPSAIKCRGLVKLDNIYEIQVASITREENVVEQIKNASAFLRSKTDSYAQSIPVLPDIVDENFLSNEKVEINAMPIGVETESLNIAKYNFLSDYITLITGEDETLLANFINSMMININEKNKNIRLVVFNSYEITNSFDNNVVMIDKDFDNSFDTFNKYLDTDKKQRNTLLIFNGIEKIYNSLSSKNKSLMEKLCEKTRDKNQYDVVFIDTENNLKKLNYETWFKNYVNTSNGIWIGNNISNQTILKISRSTRELRDIVKDNIGYKLYKGIPIRIKILEFTKKE